MKVEEVSSAIFKRYMLGYNEYFVHGESKRTSFHCLLCQTLMPNCKTICDIGGGWGEFAALCSAMGMDCTLVEDFGDPGMKNDSDPRWILPQAYGFRVLKQNILNEDFNLEAGKYDVVTCFDVIEHLHNSPKKLLHVALNALKPGGLIIISTPNCVNLLKRLRAVTGRYVWSPMEQWYEKPVFRSHVREPSVSDLLYIAKDLDLRDVKVLGRNWMGYVKQSLGFRLLAGLFDYLLRLRPSLCSNLYLTGFKRK